jgi:hypothetical protein
VGGKWRWVRGCTKRGNAHSTAGQKYAHMAVYRVGSRRELKTNSLSAVIVFVFWGIGMVRYHQSVVDARLILLLRASALSFVKMVISGSAHNYFSDTLKRLRAQLT